MKRLVMGGVVALTLWGCRTTQTVSSSENFPPSESIFVDRSKIPQAATTDEQDEAATERANPAPENQAVDEARAPDMAAELETAKPDEGPGVGGSGPANPKCDAESMTGEELDANGCPDLVSEEEQ